METTPDREPRSAEGEERRGEHNEIGYRNVDEDERHDERGGGEPPAREP